MLLLLCVGSAAAEEVNPIQMVLQLIAGLEAKVISEGEKSQKIYEGFSEWCEESNKNLQFGVKTAQAEVKDLKATIDEETAMIDSLTTKVEELSSKVKTDEADLKAATEIREGEAADFAEEKEELDQIIGTLTRAIDILQKHAGAALLQESGAAALTKALELMVGASGFTAADSGRLAALVQEADSSDEFAEDAGAPDAATYEGHSGGILETLQGLLEKAESQLGNAQNAETKALFQFQQLKQGIEDAIAYAKKEMDEAKKGINEAGEKKATAEGDLEVTTKDLAADVKELRELHADCMMKAEDFESETKSRSEELGALAEAKKVISQTVSGAEQQTYGLAQEAESFFQVRASSARFTVVRFVRELARKHNAPALAQLAKRMASALRSRDREGQDPFAKVKSLVSNMIERLEAEAQADAKHKAYCDRELSHAEKKKADRDAEIKKLATSEDEMSAKSAQLKEEVTQLQKELQEIAKSQAEMNKLRQDEKASFEEAKAVLEQGITGVKKALKVLRDYYSKDADHESSSGSGSAIIGLLEVCESDFEKSLTEAVSEEESAQAEYDRLSKENELLTAEKEQDVKYKTKEAKELDKASAEMSSDRENVEEELEAVEQYLTKLREECDEKAMPYEEQVQRRNAEIAGLKQALETLEGEAAALIQIGSSRHSLRKVRRHHAA